MLVQIIFPEFFPNKNNKAKTQSVRNINIKHFCAKLNQIKAVIKRARSWDTPLKWIQTDVFFLFCWSSRAKRNWGPKAWRGKRGRIEGVKLRSSGRRRIGRGGARVISATKRVLTVVYGVSQLLQHHVQRGVLWQFHHEHTGFYTDVPRVRLTCDGGEEEERWWSRVQWIQLFTNTSVKSLISCADNLKPWKNVI